MLVSFLPFVISSVVSATLLFYLTPFLRRYIPDKPNSRSSHSRPTPRGGGIVFVLVAALASLIGVMQSILTSSFSRTNLIIVPLILLPLALIGFIDDIRNLPTSWRYVAQIFTALLLILVSPLLELSWFNLPLYVLLVIAITAIINFTNFMDGLDGLVGGCMTLVIAAISLDLSAPWTIWTLEGALFSFFLWNWSPAKVFMGDVGSTFLGAVFAALVLNADSWPKALSFVLLATPLLGDACLCVLRRLFAGQQIFQAHRLHLFQRLHQAGWSHSQVSSLYIAATAVLTGILFYGGGLLWILIVSAIELLIGFWLDQCIAVTFDVASKD